MRCAILVLLIFSACSGTKPIAPDRAPADVCYLAKGEAKEGAIRLGIDPSYLGKQNQAVAVGATSRLAAIDCEGQMLAGAASTWMTPDRGLSWQLQINASHEFGEQNWLSASDLTAKWQKMLEVAGIASIEAKGDKELLVTLNTRSPQLPEVLLSPVFSLPASPQSEIIQVPVVGDGRDALDGDIDGLLTSNPVTIDYAKLRSEWQVVPLSWDRAYLLLVPHAKNQSDETRQLPAQMIAGLLQDVVGGSSRTFQSSRLLELLALCEGDVGSSNVLDEGLGDGQVEIYYEENDAIAQGLAERLAAQASGAAAGDELAALYSVLPGEVEDKRQWSAIPLKKGTEPGKGLGSGSQGAAVISLPIQVVSLCGEELIELLAPFVHEPAGLTRLMYVPLVEVQTTLIIKDRALSVFEDSQGQFHIRRPDSEE